jgi:hypothetical protein
LPWTEDPAASPETVIRRIYKEPSLELRNSILDAYLWKVMPAKDLASAFDLCLKLEVHRFPTHFCQRFFAIWGRRDPTSAWQRVQRLFDQFAAPANDPDQYFDPTGCIESFPGAVSKSQLPAEEQVQILRAFANRYLDLYQEWPLATLDDTQWRLDALHTLQHFEEGFSDYADAAQRAAQAGDRIALAVILRRWLLSQPLDALQMVEIATEADEYRRPAPSLIFQCTPDVGWFRLWAALDPAGLFKWADAEEKKEEYLQVTASRMFARGLLLALNVVGDEQRRRWLSLEALTKPKSDHLMKLTWFAYSRWEPERVLDLAMTTQNPDLILATISAATRGFDMKNCNSRAFAFAAVAALKLEDLPEPTKAAVVRNWDHEMMNDWADIHPEQAAQFSLKLMEQCPDISRAELLDVIAGDRDETSGDDMLDATERAFRLWALLEPRSLKNWIRAQTDSELRQSLEDLLDNLRAKMLEAGRN